ncbi:MAG: hypothetical protein WC943_16590 [Elusimicrobiota bacterium]
MRVLLFAALLLPLHASAEQCASSSSGPCTPNDDQKREILRAINAGVIAEQTINREKLMVKINDATARHNDEAEFDARKRMRELLGQRDARFTEAMRLTALYYRLDPAKKDTTVAMPDDPTGRWAAGISAKWEPRFLQKDDHYVRVEGNDKKEHFLGGANLNLAMVGGGTYASGDTVVLRRVLETAWEAQSPGPLAYIVHHEAHHFKELTGQVEGREGKGWDSYDEGEQRAYAQSEEFASVFELDEEFVRREIDSKITDFAQAGNPGHKRSLFPSPQQEILNQIKFDGQQRTQIGLEAAYESLKLRVEAARQARREREEAERRRREASEESRSKNREAFLEWLRWHGYKPMFDLDGQSFLGFRMPLRCDYYFTQAVSLDEARMALFFADACLTGYGDDAETSRAMSGILAIINARWQAPDFRSRIELETNSGPEEECLRYMRDNVKMPIDLGKVNTLSLRFRKEWQREAFRRKKEHERQQRRQEEEERRAQRRRECDPGGFDLGRTDLTPAQDALDRARREAGR